jgi:hypothetical protein
MKIATMTLALTLGLSALNTIAQEDKDRPRRPSDTPRGGELLTEREGRRLQRLPTEDAQRGPSSEARAMQRRQGGPGLGPRGMDRGRSQGSEDVAPMRRGVGPQERLRQGNPGFRPQGPRPGFGPRRGGFGPPMMGGRGFQNSDGVCPMCGRPYGPLGQQGHLRGGGPGFGAGDRNPGFGPRALGPGSRPQGRGPGFGPPPWARRGEPRSEMRSAPRGPRSDAPPTQEDRGLGPTHRGPDGPVGPKGRFQRPGSDARPDGRSSDNRPPMEHDDR